MNYKIQKNIELKSPISTVWKALTDYQEFEKWFRVKLDGPFIENKISTGHITYPGYEHLKWEAHIQKIEPEHHFSFTWHPYAIDPKVNYSNEAPTLVKFTLEKTANGTLLTVIESGFEKIPKHRRDEAFKMNENGWSIQMDNIKQYLESKI